MFYGYRETCLVLKIALQQLQITLLIIAFSIGRKKCALHVHALMQTHFRQKLL